MKNRLIKLGSVAIAATMALSFGCISEASNYTVVKGDNLWKIAKEKLGDGRRYVEIFEANKEIIKNPDIINIGQVLEIPDNISNETDQTPEVTEEETVSTFQQGFSAFLPVAIENFNTLKTGEEKIIDLNYATISMHKTQNGVLVFNSAINVENAVNKDVQSFIYEHEGAYQSVLYLNKKDGGKTILVLDHSKDGMESKLVYASTDNDDTAETEIDLADIISGAEGTIKISSTKDEATGITKKVSEIISGGVVRRTSYIEVKESDKATTVSATSFNEDKSETTNISFISAIDGDKQIEVVAITDADGTGELSFESDKDGIIASSAKYTAQTDTKNIETE